MKSESAQKHEQRKYAKPTKNALPRLAKTQSTDSSSKKKLKQQVGISIMTDPELHPLPITPNDPLQIVSKLTSSIIMKTHNQITLP